MAERKIVAEIYGGSLAEERYRQIEEDLRRFVAESLEFGFNPNGTPLFSLMELRQSYARRSVDLVDSIYHLLAAEKIVPAAILGRSLLETVGMGSLFLGEMVDCVETRNRARLEVRLARFYVGMGGQEPKPVYVMDAIRHLQKIDAEYVDYLNGKFGVFTAFDEVLAKSREKGPVEGFADFLSMARIYDLLSEISHPNGTGVQYLYPDPVNEDDKIERMRQYYKRLAVSSIWQCKHLLKSLEQTRALPELYRVNVGLPMADPT